MVVFYIISAIIIASFCIGISAWYLYDNDKEDKDELI